MECHNLTFLGADLGFFEANPVEVDTDLSGTAADPRIPANKGPGVHEMPRTISQPTLLAVSPVDTIAKRGAPTELARRGAASLTHRRLGTFIESHREVLNEYVRSDPSLLTDALVPLAAVKDFRVFLDFSNKTTLFRSQLKHFSQNRSQAAPIQLRLRRKHVFQDSFVQFQHLSGEQLRGVLDIRFKGEEGVDAGGLTKEWYEILAREMFNPDYALFQLSEDGTTFQPNPMSGVNDDHLSYFRFVGKVLGKAVADGQLLDAHFTRSFYKHILGISVTYHDIEAIDPQFYKSLNDILNMDIDELGLELYFAVEEEFGGSVSVVELIPGGKDRLVTDANKWDYVQLVTSHKMISSIMSQTNALLAGFHELIPPSLISMFTESELELLIAGLPTIDIADLKANTEYVGFRQNDEIVQWFWEALEHFDQQDRAKFLMFVTGTSKVPPGGFKSLRVSAGLKNSL
jgi:E3 ubiquitin-protein ligase HUWE1